MPGFQKNHGTRVNNPLVTICWSCWDMPWKVGLLICTGCHVGIVYTFSLLYLFYATAVVPLRTGVRWIVKTCTYVEMGGKDSLPKAQNSKISHDLACHGSNSCTTERKDSCTYVRTKKEIMPSLWINRDLRTYAYVRVQYRNDVIQT